MIHRALLVALLFPFALAGCVANAPGHSADALQGSAWRLENLGGAGVLDRVEATLEFTEAGKVAGRGSCNRFFGAVKISGSSIAFGPIGTTRMACVEAINNQEARYFKALESAERYTLNGITLLIHAQGLDKPLRFIRTKP